MNREEFEHAFRSHYSQLVSYVRTMVADEEECHDIVGMAFEGVWKNLDRIDTSTLRGYLYSSAHHLAINRLRKQKLHQQYVDYYRNNAVTAFTDEALQAYDERMAMAMKVVDTLKEPTRTILIRCYIDGKMYREVAEEMGVSVSMIKKHIGKALKTLDEFRQKMLKS
ncbi:MAG: sigma-70 family RNA polymerase sigma factor [Prevotellaceae bacterium]|nr:sigma-70 family RNA polymerase sigma factor [Prevotellaceae bacterium]